jgi:predicted dehydrogenase
VINIGIIGYGYWGPNLVRNFAETPGARVAAVADLDAEKLAIVNRRFPSVTTTTDYRELLADPSIDAIAIATPVSTHFELGRIYYYDSIRVNLGLFQRDVSVISDLAVHDFSILDHLLAEHPVAVSASGTNHFPGTPENLAYVTLFYESGTIAHANVSWLAPVKVRQILVGGSKRMITYDDLEPSEKIKVYDKGVEFTDDPQKIQEMRVGYRTGDMWAPKLAVTEALGVEGLHFVDCIENGKVPKTDGHLGLRVVELIEAANKSMRSKGETVYLTRSVA